MSIFNSLKNCLRKRGLIVKPVAPADAEMIGNLLDLLAQDNADGRAYRHALRPWLWYERPVIERHVGGEYTLTVEGPVYVNDGIGYPLGSQLRADGKWLELTPTETNQIVEQIRGEIDSILLRWMSQPRMAARRVNCRQSRFRPDDDQMARAMIASATRSTGPKEQVCDDQ